MAEDFCNHCDNENEHRFCTGLLDPDDPRCSENLKRCACDCRARDKKAWEGAEAHLENAVGDGCVCGLCNAARAGLGLPVL